MYVCVERFGKQRVQAKLKLFEEKEGERKLRERALAFELPWMLVKVARCIVASIIPW